MKAVIPTKEQVLELESLGLVTIRSHNQLPLRIVNYTPRAQYDRAWTPELSSCRRLVIDNDWKLVARPLPKFFNYEEHFGDNPVAGPMPQGKFIATDKIDGSLGILFVHDGYVLISTRGSFHSEQSERAVAIYSAQHGTKKFDHSFTHLFEIVYPENRIVVDYGIEERLVYLTSIHIETGEEEDFSALFGDSVQDGAIIGSSEASLRVKSEARKNAEGYVLRYPDGTRVKIKNEEYVRLHRIVTGLSSTSVWEHLSSGGTISQLLDPLPDEWMQWAKNEAVEMEVQFGLKKFKAHELYASVAGKLPGRKEFAAFACQQSDDMKPLLFMILDDKNDRLDKAIWKQIKPEYRKPITADVC